MPKDDLVGTIRAVGPGVREELIGTPAAAVTKNGAWATHVLIAADALVPVPSALDPALAETCWSVESRRGRC